MFFKRWIVFIFLGFSLYADVNGFIKDFYKKAFDREPLKEEISYWRDFLDKNNTATSMAVYFYKSDEFKSKNLDNEDFIKISYDIFLDRMPKKDALKYWDLKLKNGYSKEQIFYHLAFSNEFKERSLRNFVIPFDINDKKRAFISRFYALILSRDSDEEGMEYWLKELKKPSDTKNIVKDFVFSKEFEDRNLNNEDFIKILYRVFFDREADREGFDFWMEKLKEKDKKWVVSAMMESKEFLNMSEEIFKKEKFSFPKEEPVKIPKTFQSVSYTPFDDGYYQKGVDLNYTRDKKGIVIDNTLFLMWQDNVKDGGEMLTFNEAKDYCENLNFGGFDDWRLPTIKELVNLEAFRYLEGWRYSLPKIFKNVDSWKFWSQNESIWDKNKAFVVCYGQGFARIYPKSTKFHARCVRGDIQKKIKIDRNRELKVAIERNGNLMWEDDFASKSVRLSFEEAIDYCQNLDLGGFRDWRVPNAKELFSILDHNKIDPSIVDGFENVANSFYWSSTTYQRFDDEAWRVDFSKGGMEHTKKINLGFVRCVRDK